MIIIVMVMIRIIIVVIMPANGRHMSSLVLPGINNIAMYMYHQGGAHQGTKMQWSAHGVYNEHIWIVFIKDVSMSFCKWKPVVMQSCEVG